MMALAGFRRDASQRQSSRKITLEISTAPPVSSLPLNPKGYNLIYSVYPIAVPYLYYQEPAYRGSRRTRMSVNEVTLRERVTERKAPDGFAPNHELLVKSVQ